MKRLYILPILLLVAYGATAQPTLTAANSDPIIGDVFYHASASGSTITSISAGAGVTWDYSSLAITTRDTTKVSTCISTPYCDTFSTATMAEFTSHDSNYSYLQPVSGRLSYIGSFRSVTSGGAGYVHYTLPARFVNYPASYTSAWLDTFEYNYGTPPNVDVVHYERSCNAIGYGTLKTPLGVYSNVLLIKSLYHITFTHLVTGPSIIQYDTAVEYLWLKPNSHYPLANINKYLSRTNPYYALFTNTAAALATPETIIESADFVLSPNPAKDWIKVTNGSGEMKDAIITISDVSGRIVIKGGNEIINNNEANIPVSSLSNGLYLLQIISPSGIANKKFVIENY